MLFLTNGDFDGKKINVIHRGEHARLRVTKEIRSYKIENKYKKTQTNESTAAAAANSSCFFQPLSLFFSTETPAER